MSQLELGGPPSFSPADLPGRLQTVHPWHLAIHQYRVEPARFPRLDGRQTVAGFTRQIARELGVNHETLRQWVLAADKQQAQQAAGLGRAELEELRRLRRENAELRLEKEILRKAAKYFAKEMDR